MLIDKLVIGLILDKMISVYMNRLKPTTEHVYEFEKVSYRFLRPRQKRRNKRADSAYCMCYWPCISSDLEPIYSHSISHKH